MTQEWSPRRWLARTVAWESALDALREVSEVLELEEGSTAMAVGDRDPASVPIPSRPAVLRRPTTAA